MTYDVIIIGSGPGGYSAAVRAGQYGLKTALIEKDSRLGGCCLLVGCIPTKSFLHTADVWDRFVHSDAEGIHCENPRLDFPLVLDRKNKIVAKHSKGIEYLLKKNKVDWIKGYARLAGPGRVEVTADGGTQILETKNVVLATGSEARMLPGLKPDARRILTNIEILDLKEVPKTLAILGAGAVGVEFASCFQRFGTKVSIFEMLPRIVPVEDEEVSKELARVFKKTGIRVETGARVDNVENVGTGVRFQVTLADGKVEAMAADALLVAIGRKPNTDNIGLEGTGVQLERGFIKVDPYQRTGEPGVYAIGDVVAGTPCSWRTRRDGGGNGRDRAHRRQAGGPLEQESDSRSNLYGTGHRQRGAYRGSGAGSGVQGKKIGKFPFAANSKASILGQHDGFVKIVADEQYGEVLGMHIIGPQAFELIGEGVLAMEAEATVETLMHTIHAHPTIYEAVGEAFNAVYGLAINA